MSSLLRSLPEGGSTLGSLLARLELHDRLGQDRRAVNTVLDVALFLLLVSAAVGVIYAAPEPPSQDARDADDAAAIATTLTSSTATVRYEPRLAEADATVRTDRGSVGALLATATIANATVDDRRLLADERYVDAVRDETRTATAGVGQATEVQVRTRWEPLPGADVRAETTVGPAPPPTADVHAATVTVPLGTARDRGATAADWNESSATPSNRSLVGIARRDGCSKLATAIARPVVGHLFPPEQVRAALGGDAEQRRLTEARYGRVAATVGVASDDVSLDAGARDANARLARALAERFEPVACDGYTDPATAAREAAPAEVTLVVRTWSA